MLVHFHESEDCECSSCGGSAVILDMYGARAGECLRLCQNCFFQLSEALTLATQRLKHLHS